MEKVQIAVRLITPDPAAVTALNTVKAMRLQMPPLKIHRYDLWEFKTAEGGKKTISEVVSHFTDIVNPNKQTWTFAGEGSVLNGEDPELLWVGIVVRDFEDSVSGNWTDLLERRGFPVNSVRWGVLWRLGYLKNTDEALARKMALDLAVSQTRTSGLFSNPVSQEVSFWT
ncbi:MAG: hypothetical protein J7K88_13515 [Candidatus Fermentibacteraceae bacterium]|nr:hypothetical protein [Candidatus Fermentibacteraceae bacterium]